MAKKKVEYVVGVLQKDGSYKYVTDLGDHHTAYWKDGKEAMTFSLEWATDMCRGFAWNGIVGQPMVKLEWRDYINPEKKEEEA